MEEQSGWKHLQKDEELDKLGSLFEFPVEFVHIQEFLVQYLARVLGANEAYKLIQDALNDLHRPTIQKSEDMFAMSDILRKLRGPASIAGQILALHGKRMDVKDEIGQLERLFGLPEEHQKVQDFLIQYLPRVLGAKEAYQVVLNALDGIGRPRISSGEDMIDLADFLKNHTGPSSIAGQIFRLQGLRLQTKK